MGILDRFSLDGKVAVVTGASSGLGVAFATALAEAGADVAIGARRVERLDDTAARVKDTGRRVYAAPLDVTDSQRCRDFITETVAELGGVDILINNAGVADAAPASRQPLEDFQRVIDVNLTACYSMAQAAGAAMSERGGGVIINIGSVIGEMHGGVPQAGYSASKTALVGLTRDLSNQWAGRKNIRTVCVEPGYFPSEMSDQLTDEARAMVKMVTPMGRFGELEELAGTVVFLASDAASYISGSTIKVDGGMVGH